MSDFKSGSNGMRSNSYFQAAACSKGPIRRKSLVQVFFWFFLDWSEEAIKPDQKDNIITFLMSNFDCNMENMEKCD